jgi:hypothetical protein
MWVLRPDGVIGIRLEPGEKSMGWQEREKAEDKRSN